MNASIKIDKQSIYYTFGINGSINNRPTQVNVITGGHNPNRINGLLTLGSGIKLNKHFFTEINLSLLSANISLEPKLLVGYKFKVYKGFILSFAPYISAVRGHILYGSQKEWLKSGSNNLGICTAINYPLSQKVSIQGRLNFQYQKQPNSMNKFNSRTREIFEFFPVFHINYKFLNNAN